MRNVFRLCASSVTPNTNRLLSTICRPFGFQTKYETKDAVESYKTPRPQITDYYAQEDKDNDEFRKMMKPTFLNNHEYTKIANHWKNELIKKQKRRERKMQRLVERIPPLPEEPKLIVHSEAIDHIEMNEQLKYDSFAIITVKGFQHKVLADDLLIVHRIEELNVGETIEISDVHLVANKYFTLLGRPLVTNATVLLNLEENTFTKKVIVFKKKRRKGYKRNMGFSHPVSVFRVLEVKYDIPDELASKAVRL